MLDLTRHGPVYVLTMRSGENRFNRSFVEALSAALDEVEGSAGPAALVTVGEQKFYSNGLDLDWLTGEGSADGPAFIARFQAFLGRVLACPVPTVAAMNGHAYAGGGMLALAHDFRVMRADRGFFCLPEVDIGLPFSPGMSAMIQAKLDASVSRDLMLTGRRIGGTEAAALRVVDETADADQLLARAIARAESLAPKERNTYAAIKRGMYEPAIRLLEKGVAALATAGS
jgi:enoyl-CoA hydratase/carnithine racemase